jgi:hypothetical protein
LIGKRIRDVPLNVAEIAEGGRYTNRHPQRFNGCVVCCDRNLLRAVTHPRGPRSSQVTARVSKCRHYMICGEGGIHYALRSLLASRAPWPSLESSTTRCGRRAFTAITQSTRFFAAAIRPNAFKCVGVQAGTWVTLSTGHIGDTGPADIGDSFQPVSSGRGIGGALDASAAAEHGAQIALDW